MINDNDTLAQAIDKDYPGFADLIERMQAGGVVPIDERASNALTWVSMLLEIDPLGALVAAFILGQWTRVQ